MDKDIEIQEVWTNKDVDVWEQRNEILHKKVNRQMDEIKKLHKESETIFDLARRFPNKTYRELEKYKDNDRLQEAGACVIEEARKDREFKTEIDYHRYWKDMYEKEHKLRQEAEGEMTVVKGIGQNSPEMKDAKARSNQLQDELDRVKKDNNDLFLRIAELTEVEESHRKTNGKLQERLTEVEEDNKKMALQIEDKINQMRKSGM